MARRKIRLLSRNTIRLRQQLRLLKGVALLIGVVLIFIYLYFFVNDIQLARAAMADALKREGRITKEGYQGRLKIKLNQSISSFDEAVPICLKLKNDQLKSVRFGGMVMGAEANDICLTASDGGTILKSSIERYNPQTGELMLWLFSDSQYSEVSKTIYLYYGNTLEARATKTNPTSTFYKAIWNFNGTFDAHGLDYVFGEFKGVKDEEGLFGLAKSFLSVERSAAVFDAGKEMEFNGSLSLSVWIKPQTVLEEQTLFTNESPKGGCRLYINKMGRICFKIADSQGRISIIDNEPGGQILKVNEWVHLVASYNQATKHMYIYVNGELDRVKMAAATYEAGQLMIFGADADRKHGFYNGLMDEFRISDKPLLTKQIKELSQNADSYKLIAQIQNETILQNVTAVDLKSFKIRPQGRAIQIHWTTSAEKHLDYFILERSADTCRPAEVTKVLSKGGMCRTNHYSATDTTPIIGASFYRLRFLNYNRQSDSSAWQATLLNPNTYTFHN